MTLTLPPPQKSPMPRKTVKISVSLYKETGKEKQLLILCTYKTNVKRIKLYQISHSSNKYGTVRGFWQKRFWVEKEPRSFRAVAEGKPGTSRSDTVPLKTDESAHLCGASV